MVDVAVKARVNALMTGAFGDAAKLAEYLTACGVEMTDTNEGIRWTRTRKEISNEERSNG